MKKLFAAAGLSLLLVGCDTDDLGSTRADRDNTAVNERDIYDHSVTPSDQSNDSADVDQVAAVRRAVLDIEDLSVNGRNVKIITEDGKVLLRGPVDSEAERQAIVAAAERLAGAGNVNDQLEIAAD